ncbi:MAG: type II toxin-antitoxin system RelE/ParE family toxin [Oscillospiraceae bacterium]|jgi:toxin ParE1/3/4|nr:type II toxin-antitoxin system RelE/ParE family toxin [Oscillospiraceae bacterium]
MDYDVKMTDTAVQQMGEIVRYISRTLLAPEAARRWAEQIKQAIASLRTMPGRCPLVEEEPWHSEGIRKMLVEHFLVYYWIDTDRHTVWVIAVLYGRRDQIQALRNIPFI